MAKFREAEKEAVAATHVFNSCVPASQRVRQRPEQQFQRSGSIAHRPKKSWKTWRLVSSSWDRWWSTQCTCHALARTCSRVWLKSHLRGSLTLRLLKTSTPVRAMSHPHSLSPPQLPPDAHDFPHPALPEHIRGPPGVSQRNVPATWWTV